MYQKELLLVGPEYASLKHAQSVCILISISQTLLSIEDHRANQCAIYLTFRAGSKSSGSQQLSKLLFNNPRNQIQPIKIR